MLDRKCKPWLLEVNHAPSFSCGSPLDLKIKLELLRNTMRLIHLQAYHKKKFKQEQQQLRQQRMQQGRGSGAPKLSIEERERLRRQQQEIAQQAWVKHEDACMGNFERIYPDDDPQRAAAYERTLAGAVTLFGRRAAGTQSRQNAAKPPPVETKPKGKSKLAAALSAASAASAAASASASTTTASSSTSGVISSFITSSRRST